MPSSRRASSSTTSHSQLSRNPRPASRDLGGRLVQASSVHLSDAAISDRPKRTGRACVRCQRRKIKCDEGPNGCKNCLDADEKCETKDPVSDSTTERGHAERLALQLARKDAYNQRLIEFCKHNNLQPPDEVTDDGSFPLPGIRANHAPQISRHGILPAFDSKTVGENYLGAATTQPLTVPQGSRITLFDNKLNFNDFLKDGSAAYTLSDGEYNTYSSGRVAVDPPSYPPRSMANDYAHMFFTIIAPFTPVIHRPDMYKMMDRIYDGQRPPLTDAEQVMFQMMLSIVGFQIAVRERNVSLRDDAKARFLYSLTFVQKLTETHTLQNLQALAILCVAMRNLQRPGPAWKLCGRVFTLFIELGLHRSAQSWEKPPREQSEHEIHMNQRLFWTLLVVTVNINAKFGKPMPIVEQYIDVEIPQPRSDSLPKEPERCTWHAAPFGFELTRLMLQVHMQLGALRQTAGDRDAILARLLEALDKFDERLPEWIRPSPKLSNEDHIGALYLQVGLNSTKLMLRHPANLNAEDGFEMSEENLSICLGLARKIRTSASVLKDMYALDTTLYYNMDFLCAIFITIFVYDKRHQAAQQSGESARHIYTEMEREATRWRPILEDVGANLGSGNELANDILRVFERCITRMKNRPAPPPLPAQPSVDGMRVMQSHQDASHFRAMHAQALQHVHSGTGAFAVADRSIIHSPSDYSTIGDSHATTPGADTSLVGSPIGIPLHESVAPYDQMLPLNDIAMYDAAGHELHHGMLPDGVSYNFADPVLTGQGAQEFHRLGEQAFAPGWNHGPAVPSINDPLIMQQPNPQWVQQFHVNHGPPRGTGR